ncbi:MAG: hypothetical protein U9N53_03995, partial [Bacteroidota bacterium]|nr:hypothetical protein [Bacteroidota bacterium]
MNILFELNHPAHFYLFINAAKELKNKKHTIAFVIKEKDILKRLIAPFYNDFIIYDRTEKEKKKGLVHNFLWMVESDIKTYKFCKKFKPDI